MGVVYKQYLGIVSHMNLWVVDGCFIRDRIDIAFTDVGQPLHQPYVPQNEIWVDDLADPRDMACSLFQAMIEYSLMSKGWSFDGARAWAGVEESRIRKSPVEVPDKATVVLYLRSWFQNWSPPSRRRMGNLSTCRLDFADLSMASCNRPPSSCVYRIETLGKIDGYTILVVDGNLVRTHLDVYFTQGGNPARYGYIPRTEIWVEKLSVPKDQAATLFHELVETWLMRKASWPYLAAHDEATLMEKEFRDRVPRGLVPDEVLTTVQCWYKQWQSTFGSGIQRLGLNQVNRLAGRYLLKKASDNGKPFGYLMTLDLYGCRKDTVDDLDYCYHFLEDLVDFLGMEKQSPPFIFHSDKKRYPDKAGLSGWIPLIESGIQIHTLTVKRFVSVDIYSCNEFSAEGVEKFVDTWFSPEKVEKAFIERGKEYNRDHPNQ